MRTDSTPGACQAAVTSMAPTRAWACGLRTNAACSRPGRVRSATKRPRPSSILRSSFRGTAAPDPAAVVRDRLRGHRVLRGHRACGVTGSAGHRELAGPGELACLGERARDQGGGQPAPELAAAVGVLRRVDLARGVLAHGLPGVTGRGLAGQRVRVHLDRQRADAAEDHPSLTGRCRLRCPRRRRRRPPRSHPAAGRTR